VDYIDLFTVSNEAPKGSSGWYLPSPKELVLINNSSNESTDIMFYTNYGEQQIKYIKKILTALKEKDIAEDLDDLYWSSSELEIVYNKNLGWYGCVVLLNSSYGYVSEYDTGAGCYARAICAF
jgi:hypothetical protein